MISYKLYNVHTICCPGDVGDVGIGTSWYGDLRSPTFVVMGGVLNTSVWICFIIPFCVDL